MAGHGKDAAKAPPGGGATAGRRTMTPTPTPAGRSAVADLGGGAGLAALQRSAGNTAVAFGIQRLPKPASGGGRCSCGGQAGPDGECVACRARRLAGLSVQRAPLSPPTGTAVEVATADAAVQGPLVAPAWLVEDGAEGIGAGQATKSIWLSALQLAICDRADRELAGTPQSTEGCPFIGFWIGYFSARSAAEISAAAVRYAPELVGVTTASDAIAPIVDRVGAAVAVWVETGQITGVPPGVGALGAGPIDGDGASSGDGGAVQRKAAGGAGGGGAAGGGPSARGGSSPGGGGAARSGLAGAAPSASNPVAILGRLGDGRPLDAGVRSRMEPLFGQDFSAVRVHDDREAAALSTGLDAHAFTVGQHIALGSDAGQPGTLAGDALLAHELAHVVQQAGASRSGAPLRDGTPAYEAFEQDADTSAARVVASLWGGAKAAVAAGLAGAVPRMRAGLGVQRCRSTVYHCPKGKSWQQLPNPTGMGPACLCVWKCLPGEAGKYVAPSYDEGPAVRCPPENPNCGESKPIIEEIPEEAIVKGPDGVIRDYSGGTKLAPGAHFTPVDGAPMCGCLPLDVKGAPTGEETTYTPMIQPSGLELTDAFAHQAGKAMNDLEGRSSTRPSVPDEPVYARKAPMTQEPPPAKPAAKTPAVTTEAPPAAKIPEVAPPAKPPTVVAPEKPAVAPEKPAVVPEKPAATTSPPPPAKVAAPPPPPSTARTQAADLRVAETQSALAKATTEAQAARTKVKTASDDLDAARQLAAEPGSGKAGKDLVTKHAAELKTAQGELKPLEASLRTATNEATAATGGRDRVAALEVRILQLEADMNAELNPPGGFTKDQLAEGRKPGIEPLAESRLQPSGTKYNELKRQLAAAKTQLGGEVVGLTSTLRAQVDAAVPGRGLRPEALANAAALDRKLQPAGGVPVDVTTGKPMPTPDWAIDHIMSRSEIARDPRFARLTPQQRSSLLLAVPENWLPMTGDANSSKGARSVDAWIAARAADGKPIPADVATALRAADARARAAIEARFQSFR